MIISVTEIGRGWYKDDRGVSLGTLTGEILARFQEQGTV